MLVQLLLEGYSVHLLHDDERMYGRGMYGCEVGFGHACGRGAIDGYAYGSGSKTGRGDHVMGIGGMGLGWGEGLGNGSDPDEYLLTVVRKYVVLE
jgi:hypothetical protein